MSSPLTKTLVFQLDIDENEDRLDETLHESRRVYNETIRLAKQGEDRDAISSRMQEEADLVKNSTQRIVEKSLRAMENCSQLAHYNRPSHTKTGQYPLRSNHGEGYDLFLDDASRYIRIDTVTSCKHVPRPTGPRTVLEQITPTGR